MLIIIAGTLALLIYLVRTGSRTRIALRYLIGGPTSRPRRLSIDHLGAIRSPPLRHRAMRPVRRQCRCRSSLPQESGKDPSKEFGARTANNEICRSSGAPSTNPSPLRTGNISYEL